MTKSNDAEFSRATAQAVSLPILNFIGHQTI
jgi:hypothetical protein